MNNGQEQFLNFILDCTQEGKEEEAKSLLTDSFKRQAENSFSKEDLETFHTNITNILKPERKDEVIAIMSQFGGNHISK